MKVRKKDKKNDVKGEDPKTRKFSRRDALKAGLAIVGGMALSRCSSESKPRGDGSTGDASDLDGTVDASNLDGSADVNVLDASIPDAEVMSCPVGTDEEKLDWFLQKDVGRVIGTEYKVTYTAYVDQENIKIDVDCVNTEEPIVTEYNLALGQEAVIPLGGKNLRITVTQLNTGGSMVDATVE